MARKDQQKCRGLTRRLQRTRTAALLYSWFHGLGARFVPLNRKPLARHAGAPRRLDAASHSARMRRDPRIPLPHLRSSCRRRRDSPRLATGVAAATATDIQEWHDLDTNATLAKFTYGAIDPSTFLGRCRREQSRPRNPSRKSWWPSAEEWGRVIALESSSASVRGTGRAAEPEIR